MVPQKGPLPSLKGSEVRALGLYRVYQGYTRGAPFYTHTKGPPSTLHLSTLDPRALRPAHKALIRGTLRVSGSKLSELQGEVWGFGVWGLGCLGFGGLGFGV